MYYPGIQEVTVANRIIQVPAGYGIPADGYLLKE
jgi:hypothetical protein